MADDEVELEVLWTPEEVAEFLSVPVSSLPALRANGLPSVKLGPRMYRYRPSSVVWYVEDIETWPTPGPDPGVAARARIRGYDTSPVKLLE